jgi:uncharacterized protein (DUF983 family)
MTSPTCPECGAGLPSDPWVGGPVRCFNCGTAFGRPRRTRRPRGPLLAVAVLVLAVLSSAACALLGL